ncbi:hypothetical protein ACKI1H_25680 [Pseudomonas sp. YH-1]|uniref:hypothetical protein n=1 Tax=Pseudomonas sp. YH-1 TaxID=3384787 RepID=UPI003F806EF8
MYTDSVNIKKMLDAKVLVLSEEKISIDFARYLESLPWRESGLALDWEKISGDFLAVDSLPKGAKSNYFQNNSVLVFFFSPDECCVFCEIEFGLSNIEEIFWRAPGVRYFFGASLDSGMLKPSFKNFAEYDGLGHVRVNVSED